jgi:mono/diheme cytochrome c family protein
MRTLLALIGLIAILVAAAAGVFFFGGFFSVAATDQDPDIVNWALIKVRGASIDRHSKDLVAPAPAATDPQAGARLYDTRGCINCHGAPGVEWGKWSEGLNPDPPDLKDLVPNRTPRELFWVVKHGIKMTGMPSFGAAGMSDEELWKVVAFLQKLPAITPEEYKAWTAQP